MGELLGLVFLLVVNNLVGMSIFNFRAIQVPRDVDRVTEASLVRGNKM